MKVIPITKVGETAPHLFELVAETADDLLEKPGGAMGFVGDGRHMGYIVIKVADAQDYLPRNTVSALCSYRDRINDVRRKDERGSLEALVIEKDWPEYQLALEALNARIAGAPEGGNYNDEAERN